MVSCDSAKIIRNMYKKMYRLFVVFESNNPIKVIFKFVENTDVLIFVNLNIKSFGELL